MFENVYAGKKVLITGNTGFKGSWLSIWLTKLGADVYGVSKDIPTNPSMFEKLNLASKVSHNFSDVRDYEQLKSIFQRTRPDFVFHLAAQPIVVNSYKNPIETISTNVIGTMNVLEALRETNLKCNAIIITSDKCYDNVEWIWGYKETDHLGGKDIYSGSKGAAELIFKSYYHSFFKDKASSIRLVSVRAGNVIGGGDWADFRIVPDCIKSWIRGQSVEIRNPNATRPWQHVLEPLSGYLSIGQQLNSKIEFNGESYNFGPHSDYNKTVYELLQDLSKYWSMKNHPAFISEKTTEFHEAGLLKLNCDKALYNLKWAPTLNYDKNIEFTGTWYYNFYLKDIDMFKFTLEQISEYEKLAINKGLEWTK
jgi:CDP-glucose 4,6-dehydratase